MALRLARVETALAAIRAKLLQNCATSPLFDTSRGCCHLETAYETMWARHERGVPPESFSVAPIEA